MGYQTDKEKKCLGTLGVEQGQTENEYGEPIPPPPCDWITTSTYSDECTVCGAIARYG